MELAINPYQPPDDESTLPAPTQIATGRNPARSLLNLFAIICLYYGCIGVPAGLFVGWVILLPSLLMLLFGASAIWIARLSFDDGGRITTATWGVLATLVVLATIVYQPPSISDIGEVVMSVCAVIMVAAVPVIALTSK